MTLMTSSRVDHSSPTSSCRSVFDPAANVQSITAVGGKRKSPIAAVLCFLPHLEEMETNAVYISVSGASLGVA